MSSGVAAELVPRGKLGRDGALLMRGQVRRDELEELLSATERLEIGSGIRFAVANVAGARELAEGAMLGWAEQLIGSGARVTRSILFDKSAASNWLVPYHQDLTIAVRERREVSGFGPWSVKEGTPHVQPPAAVLGGMVTLRLHLDPTPATNGALRTLRGTHLLGVLSPADIATVREQVEKHPEVTHAAMPGDLLAMKPLVLHASSKSTVPSRRRVLHVEYAVGELPGGLAWAEGE